MRSHPVVVTDVFMEDAPQVALVEDDHVVQALAAQGSDQPLRDGVCVGRPHRREHRLDSDAGRLRDEVPAVAAVPVSNQEARYLGLLANAVRSALRSKHDLVLENLALRQQLAVLTRQRARTFVTGSRSP